MSVAMPVWISPGCILDARPASWGMGANGTDDDIAVATEDGAHQLMGF